ALFLRKIPLFSLFASSLALAANSSARWLALFLWTALGRGSRRSSTVSYRGETDGTDGTDETNYFWKALLAFNRKSRAPRKIWSAACPCPTGSPPAGIPATRLEARDCSKTNPGHSPESSSLLLYRSLQCWARASRNRAQSLWESGVDSIFPRSR